MTVTGPEHQHPGYEENISIHRTCVHNTQQYKNWKIIKACRSFVPSPHQSDSLSICIFALDGNIIQKEMNQMKKLTTCTYYVDCDGRDILSLLRAQAKAGAAWAWAQRSWRQRVGSSHHVVIRERHNCNAHQSEGRVGIFKYNLQMQVKGAFFASYLQTAGYDA